MTDLRRISGLAEVPVMMGRYLVPISIELYLDGVAVLLDLGLATIEQKKLWLQHGYGEGKTGPKGWLP